MFMEKKHMLPETMDERFASLEEKLIKELADVKWLLYSILEQHPNHLKDIRNAILYDDTSDNYLSPRQDEIDKFNNTLQNLSTTSGQCNRFKLTLKCASHTQKNIILV